MNSIDLAAVESATLVVALLVAVIVDLRRHRIPNWLSLATLVAGLAWHCVTTGWTGLATSAGGAVASLACFLPFYVRRAMGAGDVKWMASIGAFFGFKAAFLAVACALIAGGLTAIGYLLWRALRGAVVAVRQGEFAFAAGAAVVQATLARRDRLPFALPIALGALAALLVDPHAGARLTGWWSGH